MPAHMLLGVFFISGALAACPEDSKLFITAPKKMEALRGSCLRIPCTFRSQPEQAFDGRRETSGDWNRNFFTDLLAFFIHRSNNVIGDLSQKNCTTLFSNLTTSQTNTYYFRINNGPFRAAAACDPLEITVKDSAPRPRLEIPGDLKENQSVSITCSAPTPCPQSPPQLTWSLQQDPHNIMEENPDGTFTTKIQETLTLSEKHDGHNISCSARYPVDGGDVRTSEETMTLNVSYSLRDTLVLVSPPGPVTDSSEVNLTCSCRGNPPALHFNWFMMINGRLEMIPTDTKVHGYKVSNVDQGRTFYCGCINNEGIHLSTGRQLIFEGDGQSGVFTAQVIGKIVGILMLVITLVVFECWFRSRHQTKPVKDMVEEVYMNTQT